MNICPIPVVRVVCGIIRDGRGALLVCQRAEGKTLANHWEFPGGKTEEGESPEQALARELREELGIEVKVGEALSPVEWRQDRTAMRLLPFHCRVISGVPIALDHQQIEWCMPSTIRDRLWAPADLPILEEVLPVAS